MSCSTGNGCAMPDPWEIGKKPQPSGVTELNPPTDQEGFEPSNAVDNSGKLVVESAATIEDTEVLEWPVSIEAIGDENLDGGFRVYDSSFLGHAHFGPPAADNDDENVCEIARVIAVNPGYPDGNPKTLMGAKKPDPSVVPPIGILHLATAMMNGAEKYGPFNWRGNNISTRPYIAAALRHLFAYLDGEEYSADTVAAGRPVHHLGHVMACCAIVLDAKAVGQLNDNRPEVPGTSGASIENYAEEKKL
jgi:hypothetical protein